MTFYQMRSECQKFFAVTPAASSARSLATPGIGQSFCVKHSGYIVKTWEYLPIHSNVYTMYPAEALAFAPDVERDHNSVTTTDPAELRRHSFISKFGDRTSACFAQCITPSCKESIFGELAMINRLSCQACNSLVSSVSPSGMPLRLH